jgi:hypothetical protein
MERDGIKYYWCDHHGWCRHKTSSCSTEKNRQVINKHKKEKKEQEQKEKENTATNDPKGKEKATEKNMLKLAKAFIAISEPAEDTDNEFD